MSTEHADLAARLRRELEGEVLFDDYSRARYSTDASIYQVRPIGVALPKSVADIQAALALAREAGVPVLPRGAGTSQCGQTVAEALVLDTTKHLGHMLELDTEARRVRVEPGIVLDWLNTLLKPHGLFFPVDPSTASRATIGGMTGNNSCGSRSIRYGLMVHNVHAIEALLASGVMQRFADTPANLDELQGHAEYRTLVRTMRAIAAREADELDARLPKLLRRVGGYNLDSVLAGNGTGGHNMAKLLVGSEGTLAFFTAIELDLQPIPAHKVLGICHFASFYEAMDSTRHIVELDPSAVEVVDRNLIDLAREIPAFRATMDQVVKGEPDALLFVEFAGEDHAALLRKLDELHDLMGTLGVPGGMSPIPDPVFQKAVWEVRKAGLNIMMSMKGDGKPVSFIEDCAVGLDDLAEYTDRLNGVFAKHGTRGTFYAHASVGCLHVRPVLNMKAETDVRKMRAIAEETFELVREYKGSHSGEHGDGIVRSEFHEVMFGSRIVRALEEIKDSFDPQARFNPNRIVRPPRMDDRSLFRFRPGYATENGATALDWSDWGGFAGAVEMCNNNGACRKAGGVMCPSYRVTREEQHVTRGRANVLRMALSGQLGPEALTSEETRAALELCVSCKGCKRECPTGVDMARMKIEVKHRYIQRHGIGLRERLFAYMPRYAPYMAWLGGLVNFSGDRSWLRAAGERLLGISAKRALPRWSKVPAALRATHDDPPANTDRVVVLLVDTFNCNFHPENAEAALAILTAAGYTVCQVRARDGKRPLCCGRTFLSAGLVDEARREAKRVLAALGPWVARDVPIVGLEPACLLTLRDELPALFPGPESTALAEKALLFEEFLVAEQKAGRLNLAFRDTGPRKALLHGHCHQKAFGAMGAVEAALRLVPGLEVELINSSCCGMAGSFGFEAEHYAVSLRMAELQLLPAVRAADPEVIIVADGTSCRQQIGHGAQREALHVARVLAAALQ